MNPLLPGAEPLRLAGHDGGVLVLHGFGGSPFEVAPLAHRLNDAGFAVHAPLLPGHGRRGGSLDGVGESDYVAAAESAYDSLARSVAATAVIGLSMGGALALHLGAVRAPSAIVTIAAPLYLAPHVHAFVPFVSRVTPRLQWPTNAAVRWGGSVGYATASLAAIDCLLRLLARVRDEIARVSAPLLVVQSTADPTGA